MDRVRRWIIIGFSGVILLCTTGYVILRIILTVQKQPQPRGPYLQSVTSESVWVVWDTTLAGLGRMQYGQTKELGQEAQENEIAFHHAIQLTGLEPYTVYYYRIDGGSIASFRTAPDSNQNNYHFVVYGDTRGSVLIHSQIVNLVQDVGPDFVIHTGDLVESGLFKSEWDKFFRIEAPLLRNTPFYPTLGNHEDFNPLVFDSQYLDIFHLPGNELWYAFDYGNARIICLKGDGYPSNIAFQDEEQLTWLENELAANDAPWLFVYFHIGVFTSREEGYLETSLRGMLVPLFERYGVDAVFMGHHHSYERIIKNGITYIVTAGGGAGLYELSQPEPGSQVAVSTHHFVEIEVKGELLYGRAIDRYGKVIDRFELMAGN